MRVCGPVRAHSDVLAHEGTVGDPKTPDQQGRSGDPGINRQAAWGRWVRFWWGRTLTFWTRALDIIMRGFFRQGQLEVTRPDGTIVTYGDGSGTPVHISLNTGAIQKAIVRNAEMALGEGYVSGGLTVEDDDLEALFKLALHNREQGTGGVFRIVRHLLGVKRRLTLRNPVGKARQNVAHHYDLSEALYDMFLDADRQYSCAYFADPKATLDEAQLAEKRHIAAKLNLTAGQRVLDIGCGWGGMALTLAAEFDVHVTGVPLSVEQHWCQRRSKIRPLGRSKSRPVCGVRLGACGHQSASTFQGALAVRPIVQLSG